ncbi:EAL domain-containing protein [uncultured Hoeflea sp.]|uniref:putative bifunctional diguanylate cyclase/phosphodiesterase n=1 Tax=uncultured Hoeflea sp. TaxID=538666 RepID=UPI002608406D|nr:EAL domain-containing protein [uncultured Hoeflea sp.]
MQNFKKNDGSAKLDAALLLVLFIAAYFYAVSIEAFELLIEFMENHEHWQLDELLTSLALIGFGGFVFAWRRYLETRRELEKRKAAEADVNWLAHFDPLTELPNRRMLNEFARKFDCDNDQRRGGNCYVIYSIDLDGFKKINDLHGHAAGDHLLKIVASRLTSFFPEDLIVRLGGDEFVVIAKALAQTDVKQTGMELCKIIGAPMNLEGNNAEVGTSIGIVLLPAQTGSLEEAIQCADIAMYTAKKSTSTKVLLFKEVMREAAKKRADLECQLKEALSADAIEPYYQPLIDLSSNRIYGFEVLARWTLPDGTAIPPVEFIKVAEDAGLISDLSVKLLKKACRDAAAWPNDILLSFNLSPTQLADRLIGLRLINVLNETGFRPQRLEIEITESAMVLDADTAQYVIGQLQQLGIQIALDDFGTGYSSLSQMSRFKFSRLKIDQSFIRDFENDPKQNSIVRAIIALGNGLNVATTAEGIEQPSQLEALKKLGCNSGQGYLLGRPMTAEKAKAALAGPVLPAVRKRA